MPVAHTPSRFAGDGRLVPNTISTAAFHHTTKHAQRTLEKLKQRIGQVAVDHKLPI